MLLDTLPAEYEIFIQNHGLVDGLDLKSNRQKLECTVCSKAKIHSLPFKPATTRASELLELAHTDIRGPERTESLGGSKYFVTFIDDKTRYTEVIMLKKRSEVTEVFKRYKKRIENETGRKIIRLRIDNGREYLSKEFTNLLHEDGTRRQLTVEYTPQQNRVAERLIEHWLKWLALY